MGLSIKKCDCGRDILLMPDKIDLLGFGLPLVLLYYNCECGQGFFIKCNFDEITKDEVDEA